MAEYISIHAQQTAEAAPVIHGETAASPESFMPLQNVRELTMIAMSGRVDHHDRLLPLVQNADFTNLEGGTVPLAPEWRNDLVFPLEPQEKQTRHGTLYITQDYHVSAALYNGMIRKSRAHLGSAEQDHITQEEALLQQHLAERPDLSWHLDRTQVQNAYHIKQREMPEPNSDGQLISPVRIYVAGSINGVEITNHVLERGTDFARAKIWVPHIQKEDFRQDTPIFVANTLEQLRSVAEALRALAAESPTLFNGDPSAIGIPLEGVPGAYIGQSTSGSFNGEMADFWAEPIRVAGNSLPLQAGEVVTDEWLDEVASRARGLAMEKVQAAGIRPDCHALLAGQNPAIVMDVARLH